MCLSHRSEYKLDPAAIYTEYAVHHKIYYLKFLRYHYRAILFFNLSQTLNAGFVLFK